MYVIVVLAAVRLRRKILGPSKSHKDLSGVIVVKHV